MSTKGDQKSGAESSNGEKSSAPTNAWARPLQSKRATAPPPGMCPPSKPNVPTTVGFQHRERLLHLSLTLVGQKVTLHQTNGAVVEGVVHTFTPFESLPADQKNRYVLKEIIIQQQPSSEPALKDGTTLIIPASKVVFLHAVGIASDLKESKNLNGAPNGEGTSSEAFATDTQISSGTSVTTDDLVAAGNAWTSTGPANNRNQAGGMRQGTNSRAAALAGSNKDQGSAAGADLTSGSIGQWDQFKANKELFNVNATFDESLYTTELDTSKLDSKKMKEAERIAKEIQNTTTDNIHMAEERGFKVETDFDEEDLYSGVLTKDGKQRHEKVTITKKTGEEKESKSVVNPSKSSTSSTSAAPKKIMNYAAAAAKADTGKSKSAPPGFSSNGTPPSTTKDDDEKEKKNAGSSTAVVTPEKAAKEEVKGTEKSEPSKDSTSDSKDAEEKSDNSKKFEKGKPPAKQKEAPKDKPKTTTETSGNESDKKAKTKDKATEKRVEKEETKKSSKLNANAKSFSFNPSAKTFTPSFGAGATNPPTQPPQQAATTDPNMQMYGGAHPMQTPHYMQAGPMGQPGMMPMMNPQYSGMRYPSSYGMEQPMSQMQHQSSHVQAQATPSVPSAPSSGNAPTPTPGSGPGNTTTSDDDQGRQQREEDTSQTQAQSGGQQQQSQRSQQQQPDQTVHSQGPPQQQQQQIPMPYNVPPNAYFAGGMGMAPRGPGYPQFVASPQQISGRPGAPPYGMYSMQPGGMPQNMQMRGPNGAPYYPGPNPPMPYPPNAHMYPMMDDGGRGRGGRSSNSGRGGRGRGGRSGRGGRGRSNYNNNGGRNSQQQYNHHQSQQQQLQASQQQGQSGNASLNKSD